MDYLIGQPKPVWQQHCTYVGILGTPDLRAGFNYLINNTLTSFGILSNFPPLMSFSHLYLISPFSVQESNTNQCPMTHPCLNGRKLHTILSNTKRNIISSGRIRTKDVTINKSIAGI